MSDPDTADLPSDATISRSLRDVVIAIHKAGNTDDLTVKRVRSRAEEQLGLPVDFLKTSKEWKQKSSDIIHEAVEKYCIEDPEPEPQRAAPPAKASKAKPAPKKSKPSSDGPRGVKRQAAAPAKSLQKRRKTAVSSDEASDEAEPPHREDVPSDEESEPPKKTVRRPNKVVAEDSEEDESAANEATYRHQSEVKGGGSEGNSAEAAGLPKGAAEIKGDASESEMSSLIDESPVKKKRQKKSEPAKRNTQSKPKEVKAANSKAGPSKPRGATNDDPDQAEIKRLQGWLVKCGIRKVWSKELAKYDTSKEKIKHLKGMLKDAGMEGKYSNEKAASIKEQREFAKDLEAIQEGEKAWGQVEAVGAGGRPRRRAAARGAQNLAMKDPEDDEDEDEDEVEKGDESDEAGGVLEDETDNDDVSSDDDGGEDSD